MTVKIDQIRKSASKTRVYVNYNKGGATDAIVQEYWNDVVKTETRMRKAGKTAGPEWDENNRNGKRLRRAYAASVRKTALPFLQDWFDTPDLKLHFSVTAGCKCGCSPGFILTGHHGKNIWLTISD